ncbi:MAG: hypothetical protein V9F04_05425 [Dermatophilaceae bacterium]
MMLPIQGTLLLAEANQGCSLSKLHDDTAEQQLRNDQHRDDDVDDLGTS